MVRFNEWEIWGLGIKSRSQWAGDCKRFGIKQMHD